MSARTKVDEPDLSSIKEMFDDAVKLEEAQPALQWLEVDCPFCGEGLEVCIDPAEVGQDMVQDCRVCCRPIQLTVDVEDGEVVLDAVQE